MKKLFPKIPVIIILSLATILAGARAQGQDQEVLPVFIIAGHNNAANWGPMKHSDLPEDLQEGIEGVKVWHNEEWLELDEKTIKRRFGPETTYAAELKTALEEPFGIILVKKGLTSLAEEWSPEGGEMWEQLTAEVQAAGEARPIQVRGFAWVNGLADKRGERTAAYEENQKAFVAALREEFGNPRMRYVTILEPTVPEELRQAQATAEDIAGAGYVDTKDLPRPDRFHYTPEGQVKLGRMLGQKMVALLEKDMPQAGQ
jgi:lysophospholipase L1-like esterase